MRFVLVFVTLLGVCASISPAQAGSVIKRVKEHNVVRCGSVERRGLATEAEPGGWSGLNVDICRAIAGEITTLANIRLDSGVNRLSSRILPESLTTFPVIAATGTEDAQWSAIVAWTVHTLINAERPETPSYAGGAGAMPISAPEFGLDKQWQRRILTSVGNYGSIFDRHLGKGSPLRLDRGLNANHFRGGLLLSPFLE